MRIKVKRPIWADFSPSLGAAFSTLINKNGGSVYVLDSSNSPKSFYDTLCEIKQLLGETIPIGAMTITGRDTLSNNFAIDFTYPGQTTLSEDAKTYLTFMNGSNYVSIALGISFCY